MEMIGTIAKCCLILATNPVYKHNKKNYERSKECAEVFVYSLPYIGPYIQVACVPRLKHAECSCGALWCGVRCAVEAVVCNFWFV